MNYPSSRIVNNQCQESREPRVFNCHGYQSRTMKILLEQHNRSVNTVLINLRLLEKDLMGEKADCFTELCDMGLFMLKVIEHRLLGNINRTLTST